MKALDYAVVPPPLSQRLDETLNQIVWEYNQKITDLALLTSELPKRVRACGVQGVVAPATPRMTMNGMPAMGGIPQVVYPPVALYPPIASQNTSRAGESLKLALSGFGGDKDPVDNRCADADESGVMLALQGSTDIVATKCSSLMTQMGMPIRLCQSNCGFRETISTNTDHEGFCCRRCQQFPGEHGPKCMKATAEIVRTPSGNTALLKDHFNLRTAWKVSPGLNGDGNNSMQYTFAQSSRQSVNAGGSDILDVGPKEAITPSSAKGCCWRHVVSGPSNVKRIAWELCGLILVVYDLIAIPLTLAFAPPDNSFTTIFDWVELVFWTLNVPVVLTTGFHHNGLLILEPRRIFIRYSKTWFIVDAVTILPDWFFTISSFVTSEDKGSKSLVKVLRAFRLLRLARLLRLLKLGKLWNMVYDLIDSEKIGIVAEVLKMVLVLMLVNHYVACVWFVVGNAQTGDSWMKHYKFTIDDIDWGHQYVVAYHWSITQFTPSSMHVQPRSVGERVFAVVTVIFALVGFSYLVGSITGSLARLRAMGERKTKCFWLLRRFLKRNRVEFDLQNRVKQYAENMWDHQQRVMKPSSVEVWNLLSDHLKAELSSALHGPSLCIHPLFVHLQGASTVTFQRLANVGVAEFSLAPQDGMFVSGEKAQCMAIVVDGSLQYHRISNGEVLKPEIVDALEDWIAEPVLWIDEWYYRGDLTSGTTPTELLLVDPEKLIRIVNLNPIAFSDVSTYATRYMDWLNNMDAVLISDISQGEDVSEQLWELIRRPRDEKNP